MEEIEVPIEKVQEEINESAEHSPEKWTLGVALSSAILAGLAAVAALLAGHTVNEAMLEQIQSSDHWSHYQAKSIKAAVISSKRDLLEAVGKPVDERTEQKLAQYEKEQEEIKSEAEAKEHESRAHLKHHVVYARAVTFFQVAIAVAAIAVLTRRRRFWFVGMGFGLVGLVFLIQGLWP